MRGCYDSVLKYGPENQPGERGRLGDAIVSELADRDPQVLNLLEPCLTIDQIKIVMQGRKQDGVPIRWIFSHIKQDSFYWYGEKQTGKKCRLYEELWARRK